MSSDHLEHTCLDIGDHGSLAAALGDTPETVIAMHLLHRGFARAYVAGRPDRFEAAIIRNPAFNRDELTGFGAALPTWELLRERHGWSSVEVDPSIASQLAEQLEFASGRPVIFLDDIYHVLRQPVWPARVETVRLLSPADSGLLERAPPDLRGEGWGSSSALLREGIAAAAILDREIVALCHTTARTVQYADLGVATLPAWRNRGLASATAALVASEVQSAGQTPVWSTRATNLASLRVARKLGFQEVSRRIYLIL
ncbi:MAG: GCN5-related N-acetyltransferase [Thermomicrobiales bacterium]|jgi:GNAT superfamily N-acetyltransferase|nr:GCN5-related N-acetyltransferase [Thermomicrobiales bacterium]